MASVATAILLGLALVAFIVRGNGSAAPKLTVPSGEAFGISLAYHGDGPWSFGAAALCLSAPGNVTITGVHPLGGNGQLKPLGFATRPMPKSALGAVQGSLTKLGFPSSATVTGRCATGAAPTELGTTWLRTGSGNGRFDSLRVEYRSAGTTGSVVIPWKLKLCGPDKRTDEACGPPDTP
ncbi:MAG: hypothetical protein ACJ71T_10665 [Actinomycetales bacterium]